MKWFLLAGVFCLSAFIGFLFSLKYKRRALFFRGLISLSQKLDVGINFSRERLKALIDGLDESIKKSLLGLDKNYTDFLQSQDALKSDNLFKGINILKDSEKEVVFMFFKMLGRSDVDSQSKEIKNFEARFEDMSRLAQTDNKKWGGLSVKMGVIVGLAAVVLLL